MSLHGQTVVLTGASSGIGAAAAMQFAERGAAVCLLARREAELEKVRVRIDAEGGTAYVYPVDLADPDSIDACAKAILADNASIDALVNNAARSIRRPILESLDRAHDYERTMQLNYLGAIRLTMALLPRFVEQGHGHVVNVSSMSTQLPIPLFSAYLASKSALESFTRSLSSELGHHGVTTTVVYFPMVRTPMSSQTSIYKHMPMMDVDRAAGWLVRAVDNKPSRISSLPGLLGGVAMAALPGFITRQAQPLFRAMDKRLARKLTD